MQTDLDNALALLDTAIFKRLSGRKFLIQHKAPDWLLPLVPDAEMGVQLPLADYSAFLDDFLIDAKQAWASHSQAPLFSGIWTEETESGLLRLEAHAAKSSEGECYLIISNVERYYDRHHQTLQSARELLLSNDKTLAQQQYMHERLDDLLRQAEDMQTGSAPVLQVLQEAEFGIAILAPDLKPVHLNPAIYKLFELLPETDNPQPSEIVLDLFAAQYPEFDRVINTGSRWMGELFWVQPPHMSKWLQLSIFPVKSPHNTVTHWLLMLSDISRVKYLLQNNEQLSMHDLLTELPNRYAFWQNLEQSIMRKEPLFLLHLDIKNFKQVNERFGHQAGDDVILQLVKRIQNLLTEQDFFARIGGDEFAIIRHHCFSQNQCTALTSALLDVTKLPFYTEQRYKCEVGLSIGAAQYPADADSTDDLIRFADLAGYESKRQRRSNVQFYSSELKEASRKRLEIESALREALDDDEFELYLQPILDLSSGEIIKAEVLLRWQHPEMGLVMPDDFIPIAEQTGLIIPMGKWVISESIRLLTKANFSQKNIKLSINLSPSQISDRFLLEFIQQQIELNSVDARMLELELTEGVLVDDYDRVSQLLSDIREMGISIAIDDFGTGYSSLSYLQKLPIDHLKIDRTFVQDLEQNPNDKAIVLAVIAMAHSLNLGVIAEGVETEQQKRFLQQSECNTGQGYLFSRPVPVANFMHLLKDQS